MSGVQPGLVGGLNNEHLCGNIPLLAIVTNDEHQEVHSFIANVHKKNLLSCFKNSR